MNAKILVVDDEKDVRALMVSVLDEAGYQTVEACDGVGIVDRVLNEQPDLIMLDLTMPEVDGFAALEALKNDARTRDVPVIIASAQARKEHLISARDGGASDFIIKPWEDGEVEFRVNSILTQRAA